MSKNPNEFSKETRKKTTCTKIIKIMENVLLPLEEPKDGSADTWCCTAPNIKK